MSARIAPILAILPPVPDPPTYASVKAAYHAPLLTLLHEVNESTNPDGAQERMRLCIAIPCPHLWHMQHLPRSNLFPQTQEIVANIYKLVCIISARNGYNVQGAEVIDTQVLLVAYPRSGGLKAAQDTVEASSVKTCGPILSLEALAKVEPKWSAIYSVETEEGECVLQDFLSFAGILEIDFQRLRGGTSLVDPSHQQYKTPHAVAHYSVANGGTYDHLHIGHKLLLTMTAFALDPLVDSSPITAGTRKGIITIGVTAEDLLKSKKYAEFLEPWRERFQIVHDFLCSIMLIPQSSVRLDEVNNPGPNGHAVIATLPDGIEIRYVEIWDACGPTITDKDITALVLSEETRGGGDFVNKERASRDMGALQVFEVTVIDAVELEDEEQNAVSSTEQARFASKLSSTEIRKAASERASKTTK